MSEPKYGWVRNMGLITSIPFLILVSVGIGMGLGLWLDGKLGTTPWLAIVLTLLGLASGLYESVKLLINATRDE